MRVDRALFWAAAASGGASAAASPSASGLPHGLLPAALEGESLRVHAAVLEALQTHAPTSDAVTHAATHATTHAACSARLAHVRNLVVGGDVAGALDLALALHDHAAAVTATADRDLGDHFGDSLHADCLATAVHVGEATLATKVASDRSRRVLHVGTAAEAAGIARPKVSSSIRLHGVGGGEAVLPVVQAFGKMRLSSRAREAVVGFGLDGVFYLADAPLRCRPDTDGHSDKNTKSTEGDDKVSGGGGAHAVVCSGGAAARPQRFASAHAALDAFAASPSALKGHPLLLQHGDGAQEDQEHRALMTTMGAPLLPRLAPGADGATDKADDLPGTEKAVGDASTSYVLGTKAVLAIPICPSSSPNCYTETYPNGWCYGLVASVHGCTAAGVAAYVDTCHLQIKRNEGDETPPTTSLSVLSLIFPLSPSDAPLGAFVRTAGTSTPSWRRRRPSTAPTAGASSTS